MPQDIRKIAEETQQQVQAGLKKIGDDLRAHAEETEKELKRRSEMTEETRATVDELLTTQGELMARLKTAEQVLAEEGRTGRPIAPQSAGRIVVESEQMQDVNASFRGSNRIIVPRAALTPIGSKSSDGKDLSVERDYSIQRMPERRMTIRDLIAPGRTTAGAYEYLQETGFTNNAAMVGEGNSKPYSDIELATKTAAVRTIAHLFKATRQILDDMPTLMSFIDARASYGLALTEEAQLLFGDNTGNNLSGIVPVAENYAAPAGVTIADEQHIDRLRLALLQAELAEYPADGIVLNPTDWAVIETLKDKNGNYLIGKPDGETQPRLWRRPVVTTSAMPQGDYLAGAFGMGAQIFDRMDVEIIVSTENDKDFEKNLVSIRAEQRLALAVYRSEAFVTGTLPTE